jgi:hypothetical protein
LSGAAGRADALFAGDWAAERMRTAFMLPVLFKKNALQLLALKKGGFPEAMNGTGNDTRRILSTDPPRDRVFPYRFLINEIPDDAIELVGVLHEHKVIAALFRFKNLHLRVGDL